MKFKYMNIFRDTAETLLLVTLPSKLMKLGYEIHQGHTYLYAPGELPVCLVAHVDVVHKRDIPEIFYDSKKGILWSPDGIGGDDRAGIAGILELLNRGHRPHVLFLDLEESGCIGAFDAVKELDPPQVNFLIELDRKGYNDACFYDLKNKKFERYIESFGFKSQWGLYTDICELCPEWGIAGVNLSIGYYNPHTTQEYVKLLEWRDTIDKVERILKSPLTTVYKYASRYGYSSFGHGYYNYDYGYDFDEYYYRGTGARYGNLKNKNTKMYGTYGLSEEDRKKLLKACGEYDILGENKTKDGPVPKYRCNNDPDSPYYGCREYYDDYDDVEVVDIPNKRDCDSSIVCSGYTSKYNEHGIIVEKEFKIIATVAASYLSQIYGGPTVKWADWLSRRIQRIELSTQDKMFDVIDNMVMEDYNYIYSEIISSEG